MEFEKEATFTIKTIPVYVHTECPYCGEEIRINYNDFVISDNPDEMIGEIIKHPYCGREIKVEEIEWD